MADTVGDREIRMDDIVGDRDISIPSDNHHFPNLKSLDATLHTPKSVRSRQIVVIAHGHAGHRDYCYQRALAHALDVYSIRFEFTGCGKSLGNGTPKGGESSERPRLIASDLHDLATVVSWCRSQGYNVTALVGHSRGGVACLQYATQDHAVPTVINCSGRFRGHLILRKVEARPGYEPGMVGYWEKQRAGPGGEIVDKWVLMDEIRSVGDQEMLGLSQRLAPEQDVCVIFGTHDNVVPPSDLTMFVNELGGQCQAHLVDEADHNFFVPANPPHRPQRGNKNPEVVKIITEYLSEEASRQRFLRRHRYLPRPRFLEVEGTSNLRDIGGLAGFPLGVVYRSADMSDLTAGGAQKLALYIDTIFDLRSDPEVSANGAIGPVFGPNQFEVPTSIRRMHTPIFRDIDYSPAGIAKFFGPAQTAAKPSQSKDDGMVRAYRSILRHARPVIGQICAHLAEKARRPPSQQDGRGIMIHCSAGKDRTGVICAVLLLYAGVPDEVVAREYELTTFGLSADARGASKLAHAAPVAGDDAEHVKNVGEGSRIDVMRRLIAILNTDPEFGGIDRYMRESVDPKDLDLVKTLLSVRTTRPKL